MVVLNPYNVPSAISHLQRLHCHIWRQYQLAAGHWPTALQSPAVTKTCSENRDHGITNLPIDSTCWQLLGRRLVTPAAVAVEPSPYLLDRAPDVTLCNRASGVLHCPVLRNKLRVITAPITGKT